MVTMETMPYLLPCAQQQKEHLAHSMCSIHTCSFELNITLENLNREEKRKYIHSYDYMS